jgi:hypothetical protein
MLRRHHVAYKPSPDRLSLARDGERAEKVNFLCKMARRLGRGAEVLMDIVAEPQILGGELVFGRHFRVALSVPAMAGSLTPWIGAVNNLVQC